MDDTLEMIGEHNVYLRVFSDMNISLLKAECEKSQKRWQNGNQLSPFDGIFLIVKGELNIYYKLFFNFLDNKTFLIFFNFRK